MKFLVDTNVISEFAKPEPDPSVQAWFEKVDEERYFISVLSVGELRKGAESAPDPKKRARLRGWIQQDVIGRFQERVLGLDLETAELWGRLSADAERPLAAVDSLIAATAMRHELTVLTRNIPHFKFHGLSAINPWKTEPPKAE